MVVLYTLHVFHFQAYSAIVIYFAFVVSIACKKMIEGFMYADAVCKLYHAAASVAAHAAFASVRIEVDHFKIIPGFQVEHHQTIGTNAKTAIAKGFNLFFGQSTIGSVAVIENYKIVPCALVFMKNYFHADLQIYYKRSTISNVLSMSRPTVLCVSLENCFVTLLATMALSERQ